MAVLGHVAIDPAISTRIFAAASGINCSTAQRILNFDKR